MADNYLEKKMDDYRRGITAKVPRRAVSISAVNPALAIDPQRLMLFVANKELLAALLATFRDVATVKAAFAMKKTDYNYGSKLAQSTGSLFVPVEDVNGVAFESLGNIVTKHWGGIDCIITDFRRAVLPNASLSSTDSPKIIYYNNVQNNDLPNINNIQNDASDLSSVICVNIPQHPVDLTSIAKLSLLLLTAPADQISSITLK